MSSKADIAVSYDLDPEFFRLWLDRRMNYTCAVFDDTDDLDAAQLAKLDILYDFARITPESRVLDIGCGWGNNLTYLTQERGVAHAHGITLSEAQYADIVRRDMPGVTVSCSDFRDFEPSHTFDAVQSICMIEHVCTPAQARAGQAVARYREYFRKAWTWTSPGAYFALQTGLRDRMPRRPEEARELQWLSRTIFPGGMTPRAEDLIVAVSPYWEVMQLRTRREDYERTTTHWRARLRANEIEIRDRWGSELFETYDRYLTCCVNSFARRHMSLSQWCLRRIDDPE
ncbi:class I SAM-dependent methyltransferase [Nocardia sp. NPDC057030]|uniref:class I SAM-dependent methyltransferase n=1 Tax=unclassified Nocardia TaxID=2637762 RepID=UPI00363248A4